MREIKFRGKKVSNDEWVYGDLIHNTMYGNRKSIAIKEFDNNTWLNCFEVIPASVGQFTGFKDCEGKEIYEGDIIEMVYDTSDDILTRGKIVYETGSYYFDDDEIITGLFEIIDNADCFSIIGNIHDKEDEK